MSVFRNPSPPLSASRQAGMYYARKRMRQLRVPPPVRVVAPLRFGLTKLAAFKKDVSIISQVDMGLTVTAQERIYFPVTGTFSLGLTETATGDCHILAPKPTYTLGLTETAKIVVPPTSIGGAVGTTVDLQITTPVVPAGALIVLGIYNQASHVPTISDSAGNTYSRIVAFNGCNFFIVPNCLALANGGWIKAHDAAGPYQGMIGSFLLGMKTSSPADGGTNGSSNSSNDISLAQAGKATADDWWVEFGFITGNIAVTYPAGWTGMPRVADTTATLFMAITQAPGTSGINGDIMLGSSAAWANNAVAFKHA